MANTVLIGGGTGFIGSALTKVLKSSGYNVRIISRKPGPLNMTWTELEERGLPPQTTAVVSMAGQNVFDVTRRWTPGFKQNVWSSRVKTTSSLADAINKAKEKPRAFISFSGVGYYPPSQNVEHTEDSPGGDFDFLSKLAYDWEKASILEPDTERQVRRIVIRCGIVVGRNGGVVQQMYWPFYFGIGGPVGSGNHWMPWIHISDIVGLIKYSIENDKVKGVLNGVAPQIITNKDFTSSLARAMWRPAFIPVPVFILNAAFGEERAKLMTEGQKVVPMRTLALGYKFQFENIKDACYECIGGKR